MDPHIEEALNIRELIAEYSLEYCTSLEDVYGAGLMSEGGMSEVSHFLSPLSLEGKTVLDFGCGLGGVSFYILEHHACEVVALDINPTMLDRVEHHYHIIKSQGSIKGRLKTLCHTKPASLPFDDASFDYVISKGVLTHVCHKAPLFQEFHRILKTSGTLLINDWLSEQTRQWGPLVQKMIEIEGLNLFAVSLNDYRALLSEAGFTISLSHNDSERYADYNQTIVDKLRDEVGPLSFLDKYGPALHQAYITSYQAIASAMYGQELQVHTIKSEKLA